VNAAADLFAKRVHHDVRRVAEDVRPEAHRDVDVLVAVDVGYAGALRRFHVERHGQKHRSHHLLGEHLVTPAIERVGFRQTSLELTADVCHAVLQLDSVTI